MEYVITNRPLPARIKGGSRALSAFVVELRKLVVGGCLEIPKPPDQSLGLVQARIASTPARVQREQNKKLSVRQLKDENAVGVWRIA